MNYFLRYIFLLLCCFPVFRSQAQTPDTLGLPSRELPALHVDKDYDSKYQIALRRIRRVYPLALYAAEELKKLEEELQNTDSRRKQKKMAREVNQDLHDDFHFVIRDLSIQEGQMLMKLIQRETGLSVRQIIAKYRGGIRAELQENLGKIWEQNLDIRYDAEGDDWIIEQVLKDIRDKKVSFDPTVRKMNRPEFRASQKKYRINRRKLHQEMRKKRKAGSK